jgi:hypothetical protein
MCVAASLGMLRGADRLVESGTASRLVLALGGVAALVATPLGLGIIAYTRAVQSVPGLESLTPVWRPLEITSWRSIIMIGILLTVAMIRVPEIVARSRGQAGSADRPSTNLMTMWYRLGPLLLLVGAAIFAVTATRNIIWFAVLAVPELASMLGAHWRLRELRPSLSSRLVGGSIIVATVPLLAIMVPGGPVQGRLVRTALPSDRIIDTLGADDRTLVFSSLEWSDYVHLRTGSRVFADARLERYRGVDLRTYVSVTKGNVLRLEQVVGCTPRAGVGALPGVPPVNRFVIRKKSAKGLVDAVGRAAGSRSMAVGQLVRVGRVEILIRGADERTLAMSARCVDRNRIGPVAGKEII